MEFPGGNLEFNDKPPGGEIWLVAQLRFEASAFGENGLFVFPGCQIGISFEGSLETSQVSKAHFKSDVTDRLIAGLQNVDGLCHPELSQPICESDSYLLAKEGGKVSLFRCGNSGRLLQGDLLRIVLVHVFLNAL